MEQDNKNKILNVPPLRFPEFTEPWKKVKLGELAVGFDYGMNAPATEFDGVNKYIRITDIDEKLGTYSNKDIVSPNGKLEDRYRVKDNDILLARTGASVGKSYLYTPTDGVLYYAGFLIRLNVIHANPKFIYSLLQTPTYKRWVGIMSARSGQPGINSQEYASYSFAIPSDKEQYKIARLLSLLDERITTQNKIIEDLKKLKSAISLKLLHSDSWEQFRIKDIASIGRGRVISSIEISQQENPLYPVYSSQTSNDGIMGYLDDFMFEGEYISWTTDGANAGTVFYRNGKFNCTNVCGLLKLKKGFDAHFVSLVLAEATKRYVSTNLANPKLMNNTMGDIQICLPQLEDQKRISVVFRKLQGLLETHNTLIVKYSKQKQYLLSQMFI